MITDTLEIEIIVKDQNTLKVGIPAVPRDVQRFILYTMKSKFLLKMGQKINPDLLREIEQGVRDHVKNLLNSGFITYDSQTYTWRLVNG